jgi:hypothetical protein
VADIFDKADTALKNKDTKTLQTLALQMVATPNIPPSNSFAGKRNNVDAALCLAQLMADFEGKEGLRTGVTVTHKALDLFPHDPIVQHTALHLAFQALASGQEELSQKLSRQLAPLLAAGSEEEKAAAILEKWSLTKAENPLAPLKPWMSGINTAVSATLQKQKDRVALKLVG